MSAEEILEREVNAYTDSVLDAMTTTAWDVMSGRLKTSN